MIIVIKGRSNIGKSSLGTRLADALGLEPPVWPLDHGLLGEWEEALSGWTEGAREFIVGSNHVDTDRVAGLCLFLHRDRFPPPPVWTPASGREEFEDWRDRQCRQVLETEMRHEFFQLICRMVDSAPHAVVEGTAMGTNQVDSPLTAMLLFRYSQVPVVKILLTRTPYDSPTMPTDVEVVRTAYVNGRAYTLDQLVAAFSRGPAGEIVVPPHFLSRPGVPLAGARA